MGSAFSSLASKDGSSRFIDSSIPLDWQWVSAGFVNGLSLYAAAPALGSLIQRKRVDSAVWRTAVAAGCFIGGYRLFRILFRKLKFLKSFQKFEEFLSGAMACGVALGVDDHFLGSLLTIWWCLRAIRCMLPKNDSWAPVALMSVSASILNPAAFLHRDEHQAQYQKFMERFALRMDRQTLIVPQAVISKPSIHGWDKWIFCDELQHDLGGHPTSSCAHSVMTFVFPRIFMMSLKMYLPLYLAWSFFKVRLPNLRVLGENVARSTMFLTMYTITQYIGVMWFTSTISPNISRMQHASFAWLSGLWTLLERKERRPELALYCVAQAINSLYLQGKKKGLYNHTPRAIKYLLLTLASGTLTHFKEQHPSFVQDVFGFDRKL